MSLRGILVVPLYYNPIFVKSILRKIKIKHSRRRLRNFLLYCYYFYFFFFHLFVQLTFYIFCLYDYWITLPTLYKMTNVCIRFKLWERKSNGFWVLYKHESHYYYLVTILFEGVAAKCLSLIKWLTFCLRIFAFHI